MKKEIFIVLLILSSFFLAGCQNYFNDGVRGIDVGVTSTTLIINVNEQEVKLLQKMDADGSGTIDNEDFFLFSSYFGTSKEGGKNEADFSYDIKFDFNDDGKIDNDDFFLLSQYFGRAILGAPHITEENEKPKKEEPPFKVNIGVITGEGLVRYIVDLGKFFFPEEIKNGILELEITSDKEGVPLEYPTTVFLEYDNGKKIPLDFNKYIVEIVVTTLKYDARYDPNDDGKIDDKDTFKLHQHFATEKGGGANEGGLSYTARYDFNNDGKIDMDDFFIFSPYIGAVYGVESTTKKKSLFLGYRGEIVISSLESDSVKLVVAVTDPETGVIVQEERYLNFYNPKSFQCSKIIDNGPNDKKINLVVVSDGFDSLADFDTAVPLHLGYYGKNDKGFFAVEPLKSNKEKFNVFKVSTLVPFGCWRRGLGLAEGKELGCFEDTFREITKRACGFKSAQQADAVLAISSNPGFRAYAYYTGFAVTYYDSPETSVHELGHAFGQLADEYWNDFDRSYIDFNPPERENQDVEGCPKWCSGKIDVSAACYKVYEQWYECVKPYRIQIQSQEKILRSCWQRANVLSRETAGIPLYDCAIGVQCREETQCYFTSHGVGSFRHVKEGIMNDPWSAMFYRYYRYGIISEEAIQRIIDNKLKRGASKPVIDTRKIFWYDTFDEQGEIVSGGEINFATMSVDTKAKVMAKTLELSEQITPEETQRYENRIENVLKFKAAKPSVFDPEIEVIDNVVDFEKKDIDLENIEPGVLVDAYLEVVQDNG